MHLSFYEFEVSSQGFVYQFTSRGPKGDFSMVIQYSGLPNTRFPVFNPLQNLALLDKDPLTGQYSGFINTNNGYFRNYGYRGSNAVSSLAAKPAPSTPALP